MVYSEGSLVNLSISVYGFLPYTTPQQRSDLAIKEYLGSCNTISIANAYGNQTHNHIFGIAPAIHAQDLAYTFYPKRSHGKPRPHHRRYIADIPDEFSAIR